MNDNLEAFTAAFEYTATDSIENLRRAGYTGSDEEVRKKAMDYMSELVSGHGLAIAEVARIRKQVEDKFKR